MQTSRSSSPLLEVEEWKSCQITEPLAAVVWSPLSPPLPPPAELGQASCRTDVRTLPGFQRWSPSTPVSKPIRPHTQAQDNLYQVLSCLSFLGVEASSCVELPQAPLLSPFRAHAACGTMLQSSESLNWRGMTASPSGPLIGTFLSETHLWAQRLAPRLQGLIMAACVHGVETCPQEILPKTCFLSQLVFYEPATFLLRFSK